MVTLILTIIAVFVFLFGILAVIVNDEEHKED